MEGTVIGNSYTVQGEIHGEEDLCIKGNVQGKIFLKEKVVVDSAASVEADMETKSLEISGSVKGNVAATERVEIRQDGKMVGNIKAPRIMIHDGAFFKGSVDMER